MKIPNLYLHIEQQIESREAMSNDLFDAESLALVLATSNIEALDKPILSNYLELLSKIINKINQSNEQELKKL